MTKHVHHDLIVAWAADPRRVVQYFDDYCNRWEDCATRPTWDSNSKYRFKPEPKPDVVRCEPIHLNCGTGEVSIKDVGGTRTCRFTFDGETGKLKSAEVI